MAHALAPSPRVQHGGRRPLGFTGRSRPYSTHHSSLCARLRRHDHQLLHHFENELRIDYDPRPGLLTLRLMATSIHEYMERRVTDEITRLLGEQASRLLSRTEAVGHTKVKFRAVDIPVGNGTKQVEGQKHPDIQFHFKCTDDARHQPFHFDGTRRPPFVGEVGYSQHPTSLEACARQYYEEGKGEIKTILAIDLE